MKKCERHVCGEIKSLSHRIFRCIENRPETKLIDSLTGTNSWIIGYLAHHSDRDVFQKDIERHFDITRSTASKVINLMEQKGLVTRERVSGDGRLKKIVLTEKSCEIAEMMKNSMNEVEAQLVAGFTPEELEILAGYIERMKNNMKTDNKSEKGD